MLRLPKRPARAGHAVAALVALGLAAPAAFAQEAAPQPVVDHAPKRVGFGRTAVIRGHLENGAPGDEVAVEKRLRAGNWKTLKTAPVDEESRVKFRLPNRRTTATYRLSWTDPTTEVVTSGDRFRIAVRPKLTVRTKPRHPFAGRRLVVKGTLRPARGGRKVRVQRRRAGEWRTIDRVWVRDGRYRTSFGSGDPGRKRLRVVFGGDEHNSRRTRAGRVKIYDPDLATWYGPGFYGNRTACGKTLTTKTVGVAHRSLPCGTMVDIVYRGRTVRVPVIDRGPYTSAEWDLTERTAERLRFSGRNTIGTVH